MGNGNDERGLSDYFFLLGGGYGLGYCRGIEILCEKNVPWRGAFWLLIRGVCIYIFIE